MKISNFVMPILVLSTLTSCSPHNRHVETQNKVGLSQAKVSDGSLRAKEGKVKTHGGYRNSNNVTNKIWVDSTPIVTHRKVKYPELQKTFTYISALELPLSEIVGDLQKVADINFKLSPELISGVREVSGDTSVNPDNSAKSNNTAKEIDFITVYRPSFSSSTIQQAIDNIANTLGISWRYDETTKSVYFYKFRTQSYKVNIPGEIVNQKSIMTNESLAGGGAVVSGSAISTNVNMETDPWTGLIQKLDVLRSAGGRYTTDKHYFTVTLNDTDSVHAEFTSLVNEINKDSLKEIVFDITLMTVKGTQKDLYGVSYAALYENSKNKLGFITPTNVVTGTSGLTFTHTKPNPDHFEGAKIFLDALSQIGKASIVDEFQRTVLNNNVAPIMLARNRPYLRTVTNLQGLEGNDDGSLGLSNNSAATLTDLVTGFFLTLRPHIINNSDILVSMTLNRRSAPGEFEKVEIGEGIALERPDIQDDSDFRQFTIKNNETKIISSSVRDETSYSKSGTGDNDLWWLGGNKSNQSERQIMLLFVTARML